MCLIESIVYVHPDGHRTHQPYHQLCDQSRAGRPCERARYHELGERHLAGTQPSHVMSSLASLDGYATTHHRPSPPASDTMSHSKHSRKSSSQDSTNWKGAFTRPARKINLFGRRDSVKESRKTSDRPHQNEVVIDQLSPPSTPRRQSIFEAPPFIREAWSLPHLTHDNKPPQSTHRPSIRPVSYAGEPRYEIRTPTGSTPTGSTPPEGKTSKRTSRYGTTQVIQDPPVRPPEVVHGVYTPRSSWNIPKTPTSKETPGSTQDTAVPPPSPAPPTPSTPGAAPYLIDNLEPDTPTTFSTEPEVSRFQNRETQRTLAAQRAHEIELERTIITLRARLAQQDAAAQANAAERQRTAEQEQADRRRERSFRERQEAALAAEAAAREADRRYKDTAQRIAQKQAEIDELRQRRHVVTERFVDKVDEDTRAATRHVRAATMPIGPREERDVPRMEGHRTRDGRVVWTEIDRGAESSRPARRSEGRAAQRIREAREALDDLTIGSEEAVASDDGSVQGSHEHGQRRRRRRRRHHRGHRDHEDAA